MLGGVFCIGGEKRLGVAGSFLTCAQRSASNPAAKKRGSEEPPVVVMYLWLAYANCVFLTVCSSAMNPKATQSSKIVEP
jgi:hypothetical protein